MSGSIERFDDVYDDGQPVPASGIVRAAGAIDEETETMSTDPSTLSAAARALEEVTLVVYGWKHVEPGTLAWVFPSLSAAMAAAHAMRNALRWAIVRGPRGEQSVDLDQERALGAVLVERHG